MPLLPHPARALYNPGVKSYRGRFAPSPTGPLHFGSLIAAVASYLDARSHNGEWLVRIEDVDTPRVIAGAADDILSTLANCGLVWDGPIVWQSRRNDAYAAALRTLVELGVVYPCGCSRREIADSALNGIEGPVYPGTCRSGVAPGKTPRALRIDTRAQHIAFDDLLQGRVTQDLETAVGDFVLYRADGIYAYQLAVVVDDAEQDITTVVRGADLLHSTPRQIYLQRLLGYRTPNYAHVPVATDAAGEKLSKQTRALPVDAASPLPALIAALRFLGHPPPEAVTSGTTALWRWAIANWQIARVPHVAVISTQS